MEQPPQAGMSPCRSAEFGAALGRQLPGRKISMSTPRASAVPPGASRVFGTAEGAGGAHLTGRRPVLRGAAGGGARSWARDGGIVVRGS